MLEGGLILTVIMQTFSYLMHSWRSLAGGSDLTNYPVPQARSAMIQGYHVLQA